MLQNRTRRLLKNLQMFVPVLKTCGHNDKNFSLFTPCSDCNLVSLPQTASMLSAVPSALEECVHSVPDPQHLKTVLLYHTTLGHFDLSGESHLGCNSISY